MIIKPSGLRENAASSSLFYRYYFVRCSSELTELVSFPHSRGSSNCYSVTILRCPTNVSVNIVFHPKTRFWNSLPVE